MENPGLRKRAALEKLLPKLLPRVVLQRCARVRIIGRTSGEQASLPKPFDEGHLPAVLVLQAMNAYPRLGGPPPRSTPRHQDVDRGAAGRGRGSFSAFDRGGRTRPPRQPP